ncbi:MAG: hypothetical protein AAF804_10190, partial [Bacteroidota bacterium]
LEAPASCHYCELQYTPSGRLAKWSNSEYLPAQEDIERIERLSAAKIITLKNRTYYQVRKRMQGFTDITLIPVHVIYEVDNEFLQPYIFLDKWQNAFQNNARSYLKQIKVELGNQEIPELGLRLVDLEGRPVITLSQLPIYPFRQSLRLVILLTFGLGVLSFLISLRIYVNRHPHQRYQVNLTLIGAILFFRGILYAVGFPGTFLEAELFSPNILAFHWLAPSLGEMTINIVTFTAIIYILYTHSLRISAIVVRKLIRNQTWSWIYMVTSVVLSSLLFKAYIDVFEVINLNSKVDIEFSNIFKTNLYSYLILLDVGSLLLAITLLVFLFLRVNILYLRRYGRTLMFTVVHLAALCAINFLLHPNSKAAAIIVSISLGTYLYILYRSPFRHLLKYNLVNYLLITVVITLVVTYNVVVGIHINQQYKAVQIAERVKGSQSTTTVLSFIKAKRRIETDIDEIRAKRQLASDNRDFVDWLSTNYLENNFKGFEVDAFLYDTTGAPFDPALGGSKYGSAQKFNLNERKGSIQLSAQYPLYQLPNPYSQYTDFFIGSFELYLGSDSTQPVEVVVELQPTNGEAGGLYPSLSMEQSVFDDIKLINSMDHAVYREGILYTKRGQSNFQAILSDFDEILGKTNRRRQDHFEYLEPFEGDRMVLVRYPRQTSLEVITTFSFIFYFFNLASLVFFTLPILTLRLIRNRKLSTSLPLRTKIRLGLVTISILPMLVILALLYPFISQRYYSDARIELSRETQHITNLIESDYSEMQEDPFARQTGIRLFRERISELSAYFSNDINVYDKGGSRIASTQPFISEAGINTNLMHERALDSLQNSSLSDLV